MGRTGNFLELFGFFFVFTRLFPLTGRGSNTTSFLRNFFFNYLWQWSFVMASIFCIYSRPKYLNLQRAGASESGL